MKTVNTLNVNFSNTVWSAPASLLISRWKPSWSFPQVSILEVFGLRFLHVLVEDRSCWALQSEIVGIKVCGKSSFQINSQTTHLLFIRTARNNSATLQLLFISSSRILFLASWSLVFANVIRIKHLLHLVLVAAGVRKLLKLMRPLLSVSYIYHHSTNEGWCVF